MTTMEKRITLRELIKNGQPIWVINNSAEIAKQQEARKAARRAEDSPLVPMPMKAGQVVFRVGSGENGDTIVIPPGPDPVCISDQVDPESLRSCRDLFKLTDRKALLLMDPDKAEDYYAKNEKRRTVMQQKVDDFRYKQEVVESVPEEVGSTDVPIDSAAMDVCLKLKHKAINKEQAMERLIELEGTFSDDDLSYVAGNGRLKMIKQWAKDALESRQS